MKKALAFLLSGLTLISVAFAADVSTFVVQISPTTTNVNEAADLTVKALDANGNVVKDYAGDIFIDLSSTTTAVDSQDYTLPSDGIYTFVAGDQGVKTFSKGLVVKKSGTFKVKVSEIINEAIKGEATLVVKSDVNTAALGDVSISSPTSDSTETNKTINIVGNSSLKNSPLQIYINGIKIKEDLTSSNGDFNVYVTDIQPGNNKLKVMIVDADGNEVATSSEVNFNYQPATDPSMSGFEVLPGSTVKQGQKVTFVFHGANADSVSLSLTPSDGSAVQKVILDNIDATTWKKEYLMERAGAYSIDATTTTNGTSKSYKNVETVTVLDTKSVQQVKYFVDNLDKTKLHLSWTYLGNYASGEIPYFTITYAQDKDMVAASSGIIVSGASYILSGIDLTQQYYVQISPVDVSGKLIGDPSDIILVEPTKGSAPMCRVAGVKVITKKIADKYYLSWDKVEGADRYIIYRSDSPIDEHNGILGMQKVGETSDTKFGYPYDPNAKKDTYAYYSVVAMCSDGNALQVGNTAKVKVGPVQNMMFMFLITGLLFGLYKLNVAGRKPH